MGRKTQRLGHETASSPGRSEEVSVGVVRVGEPSGLPLPCGGGGWIRGSPRVPLVRQRNS